MTDKDIATAQSIMQNPDSYKNKTYYDLNVAPILSDLPEDNRLLPKAKVI